MNTLKICSVLSGLIGMALLASVSGGAPLNVLVFLLPLALPLWYLGAQKRSHHLSVGTLTFTATRLFVEVSVLMILFLLLFSKNNMDIVMLLNFGIIQLATFTLVASICFYVISQNIAKR